jgi:hypothetical protein
MEVKLECPFKKRQFMASAHHKKGKTENLPIKAELNL